MKKFKLWPIFIVVFFNMLGFGMIIPVIRDLTEILVNNSGYNPNYYAVYAGVLMASYSFFQLIFSPILGRISDLYGRKVILVTSVVGSIISYLMWSISQDYLFFLLSRVISGITGANLSVAQSYIADVTKSDKERAKNMGIVGAIFGIGFILGPFFGGLLSVINISQYNYKMIEFNRFGVIGLFTASLSFINLIWIIFGLEETVKGAKTVKTKPTDHRRSEAEPKKKFAIYKFLNVKMINNNQIKRLILIYFFMQLGFNHIEAVLAWDLKDRFGLDTEKTGYYFAFMGIIMAFVQGGLYRGLIKKYSLINLSQVGAALLVVGFFIMPFSNPLLITSIPIILLAVGMGISSPSIMTLTSVSASESEQGITMGILQSFGSLSRVIAPLTATFAYDTVLKSSPYFISSALLLFGLLLITNLKKVIAK